MVAAVATVCAGRAGSSLLAWRRASALSRDIRVQHRPSGRSRKLPTRVHSRIDQAPLIPCSIDSSRDSWRAGVVSSVPLLQVILRQAISLTERPLGDGVDEIVSSERTTTRHF